MATIPEVQAAINALTTSSTIEEAMLLAIDTNALTQDRSIVVNTAANLPDLSLGKIAPGTVFFVDQYDVPVIATVNKWVGLDNRTLRTDYILKLAWGWGLGLNGRLGNGTVTDRSSPVSVVGGFTDWCQVSAGVGHSLGVRANGTAWAWGFNTCGLLGDGTVTSKRSPVSVVGGFTDWCGVSAGDDHSLGVRTNGTAWAWGYGDSGRLGDGTTVDKSSPVSIAGGFADWCQVSAGQYHSLGVRTNGTAWGWGCGFGGRIGDNRSTNRSSPVSVVGGFVDWCGVSAGDAHSLGVRTNGTAWAWGAGASGRLGDGTVATKSSPVSVVGGFTDWCQVSAGTAHSLGLRTNGTAWAWGRNSSGELGNGTTTNRSSPVSVVGGFTDWVRIDIGSNGGHMNGIRTSKGFTAI